MAATIKKRDLIKIIIRDSGLDKVDVIQFIHSFYYVIISTLISEKVTIEGFGIFKKKLKRNYYSTKGKTAKYVVYFEFDKNIEDEISTMISNDASAYVDVNMTYEEWEKANGY